MASRKLLLLLAVLLLAAVAWANSAQVSSQSSSNNGLVSEIHELADRPAARRAHAPKPASAKPARAQVRPHAAKPRSAATKPAQARPAAVKQAAKPKSVRASVKQQAAQTAQQAKQAVTSAAKGAVQDAVAEGKAEIKDAVADTLSGLVTSAGQAVNLDSVVPMPELPKDLPTSLTKEQQDAMLQKLVEERNQKIAEAKAKLAQGVAATVDSLKLNSIPSSPQEFQAAAKPFFEQAKTAVVESIEDAAAGAIGLPVPEDLLDPENMKGALQECVDGALPVSEEVQSVCKAIARGLAITDELRLKVVDFKIDGEEITATLDVSGWFGSSAPQFTLSLIKNKEGGIQGLQLSAPAPGAVIPISDLVKRMVPALQNSRVFDRFSATLSLTEVAINLKPFGFRIAGAANMNAVGSTDFKFNVLLARLASRTIFAIDFHMQSQDGGVSQMVSHALGPFKPAAILFDMITIEQLDVLVVSSEFDVTHFPALVWHKNFEYLKPGLSFRLKAGFNGKSDNPLAKLLNAMIPQSMSMAANIYGTSVELDVLLPEFRIVKGFSIIDSNFHMIAEGPVNALKMKLGFAATLHVTAIPGADLKFKASVDVAFPSPSVDLSLAMMGEWRNAFFIPKLTVADVYGKLSLTVVAPFIKAIGAGGTLMIGDVNDDPITGKVYFNLDLVETQNCWFYSEVKQLTINKILKNVLQVNAQLPAIIGETGFKQALFSLNLGPDTFTAAGDEVPSGVHIKGEAQLLFLKGKLDIRASKTRFKFYAELDPIVFGPIKVTRSIADKKNGPYALVDINLMPPFAFSFNIKGYINLLLFQAGVDMEITATHMHFKLQTTIFFVFDAEIEASASYGSLKAAEFSFRATLGIQRIKAGLLSAIKKFREEATDALKKASAAIGKAKEKISEKQREVRRKCEDKCNSACGGKFLQLAAAAYAESNSESESESAEGSDVDVEADVAERELSVEEILAGQSESSEFSEEDAAYAESLARVHALSQLDEQQLIEMGAMVSDDEALATLARNREHQLELQALAASDEERNVAYFGNVAAHLPMFVESLTEAEAAVLVAEQQQVDVREGLYSAMQQRIQSRGIGKFFKKIGRAVRKVASKAGSAIKSAANKAGAGIKHAAKEAGSGIKHAAKETGSGIKHAAKETGSGIKHVAHDAGKAIKKAAVVVGKAIAAGTCKMAREICLKAGCKMVDGVMEAGKGILSAAQATMKLAEMAIAAALKMIERILNALDLKISFGGVLTPKQVAFDVDFMLQIGAKLSFSLHINFSIAKLTDFILMLFSRVKSFLLAKIPGLNKLIK